MRASKQADSYNQSTKTLKSLSFQLNAKMDQINQPQQQPEAENQVWSPLVIQNLDDETMKTFLEWSSTPCIRGGGCDIDYALEVLFQSKGNTLAAMKNLLNVEPKGYYAWSTEEILHFEELVTEHNKNFHTISGLMKTKTVKDCVEFYYRWKKIRPKKSISSMSLLSASSNSNSSVSTSTANTIISNNSTTNSSLISNNNSSYQPKEVNNNGPTFDCVVCGRSFEKIKSRSAHMKRHKNERAGIHD